MSAYDRDGTTVTIQLVVIGTQAKLKKIVTVNEFGITWREECTDAPDTDSEAAAASTLEECKEHCRSNSDNAGLDCTAISYSNETSACRVYTSPLRTSYFRSYLTTVFCYKYNTNLYSILDQDSGPLVQIQDEDTFAIDPSVMPADNPRIVIRYQRGGDPGYINVESSSGRSIYDRRYYDDPNFPVNRYADYYHFMERTSLTGVQNGVFLGVMSRDSGPDQGYGTIDGPHDYYSRIEYADNTPSLQAGDASMKSLLLNTWL